MRPFGTRADAELLAQALDAPVPALPARLAAEARVVARLAALRSALAPATAVRPDFRTALRARLVAEAARAVPAAAAQAPPRAAAATAPAGTAERDRLRERVRRIAELPASPAPRRVAVLTGATAVLVLVGGIGLAADRSYPGEPF